MICECVNGDWESPRPVQEIEREYRSKGYEILKIPDLCGMAASNPAKLAESLKSAELAVVAACAPRAAKSLCLQAGLGYDELEGVEFVNRVAAVAGGETTPDSSAPPPTAESERLACAAKLADSPPAPSRPWFPVIDRDRCSDCGACLDFCLFGVFTKNADGALVVAHPENCKDNCPACARICPVNAIMFPKHLNKQINGASDRDESAHSKPIFAMSGEELYNALKNRRGKKTPPDIFKLDS
jgi:NAD-dependent dihydropyrimidine dehydrogenase PreA subunit